MRYAGPGLQDVMTHRPIDSAMPEKRILRAPSFFIRPPVERLDLRESTESVRTRPVDGSPGPSAGACRYRLDLSPKLRQTVKTHFSSNGELSHGSNTTEVHEGV